MPRKPKKLSAKQLSTLAGLDGRLAELYEAQCDGTLDDKLFENRLFRLRIAASPRRTSNPSASEIFDARINRTVKIGGKKMRRIEVNILRLASLAIEGDTSAAERLVDMRAKSKRYGDFKLEEEFDRYPPGVKKRSSSN
jgi:hypothetical protein